MLNAVKRSKFTIVVILLFLVMLWIFAQLGQGMGFLGWIDGLYETSRLGFWIALIVSRVSLGIVWAGLSLTIYLKGVGHGFFLPPDMQKLRQMAEKEKPWQVKARFVLTNVISAVVLEVGIRVLTWTIPPYLVKG